MIIYKFEAMHFNLSDAMEAFAYMCHNCASMHNYHKDVIRSPEEPLIHIAPETFRGKPVPQALRRMLAPMGRIERGCFLRGKVYLMSAQLTWPWFVQILWPNERSPVQWNWWMISSELNLLSLGSPYVLPGTLPKVGETSSWRAIPANIDEHHPIEWPFSFEAITKEPLPEIQNLYIIQQGASGPVKVGVAQDPERRLAELQCGNPAKLRLIRIYPKLGALESRVHKMLKEGTYHVQGEWFRPSALEALDAHPVLRWTWRWPQKPKRKPATDELTDLITII